MNIESLISLSSMDVDDEEVELQDTEEEEEEALSLCDLPLSRDELMTINCEDFSNYDEMSSTTTRSSSEPAEFFEFFSDLSSDMCPADDIIFCGKLVPFKHSSSSSTTQTDDHHKPTTNTAAAAAAPPLRHDPKHLGFRRRSESLSELQTRDSTTKTTTRLMRNSRSLDYRKLHRSSSSDATPSPVIDRNSSGRSSRKSDISGRKVAVSASQPKSRWYLFIFGSVKFPPEMELKDIKNRQVRRNPSALFPSVISGGKLPVTRSGKRGSWGLLRALSCKDHASVAVTASFGYLPPM